MGWSGRTGREWDRIGARCCVYAGQLYIGAGGGRRPVDGTSGFANTDVPSPLPSSENTLFKRGHPTCASGYGSKCCSFFSFFFFFLHAEDMQNNNNNKKLPENALEYSAQIFFFFSLKKEKKKGKTHTHTARIIMKSKETQVLFQEHARFIRPSTPTSFD